MPVRFTTGEGWVFDTAEEAAAFYRYISTKNGAAALVRPERKNGVDEPDDTPPARLPDSAKQLIDILLKNPDGVPGRTLAQAIGIEPKGVGSIMGTISRWGESHQLTRKEMIIKKRARDSDTGKSIRILKLTNSFRKELAGGAFDELS